MVNKKHFAVVLGARPNFVKAAPFFMKAKEYPQFKFTLIHTGQHFDRNMSKIFFEQMNIPKPDIHFDADKGLFTEKIGRMTNKLNAIFSKNTFDGVIVFGDVMSTMASAMTAVKWRKPLIHIEAGLRSHDRRMPEEISRVMVDHISDMLFTTEPAAEQNLTKEGISKKKIKYVGNLMIESAELFRKHIDSSKVMDKLKLRTGHYIVATIHRQENTDSKVNLKPILSILKQVNRYTPVILPLHPGTKKKFKEFGISTMIQGIRVIEPVGYFDFMKLVKNSAGVITDSGGIQEETSHLGVPCCTLRDNTERPITITAGSNKLFSLHKVNVADIRKHMKKKFSSGRIPFWDSGVSSRIFDELVKFDGTTHHA